MDAVVIVGRHKDRLYKRHEALSILIILSLAVLS